MKIAPAPLLAAMLLALATGGALASTQDSPAKGTPCTPPPGPPPDGKAPPADADAQGRPPRPAADGKGPPPCPPPDAKGRPPGPPPGAPAGAAGAPPGPPPGQSSSYTLSAQYTVAEARRQAETGRHYFSDEVDVSAVWVRQGGELRLADAAIDKRGDSTSHENSSFYGLNAALLVTGGGRAELEGGTIQANGLGANAVSSIDQGSHAALTGTRIVAAGDGAHGVDVSLGGSIALEKVDIATSGASAAAVATDRGGGRVSVEGGVLRTSGLRSPGLYSTGTIEVRGADIRATGAEAAVVEGSNSIEVVDSRLVADRSWGAMLYQSFSGDAQGQHGRYVQRGGSFQALEGPLFYVTNATGEIVLENVQLAAVSGVLVKAGAGQWGTRGSNGGHAILQATRQRLPGDLVAEDGGSIEVRLEQRSVLEGRVLGASLEIDASSHWDVRGDSTVARLTLAGGNVQARLARLRGNGHSVAYDAKAPANAWLGGKRWDLPGGGQLLPES